MRFQRTADKALTFGRFSIAPGRLIGLAMGSVLAGAVFAGPAGAETGDEAATAVSGSSAARSSAAARSGDWALCRLAAAEVEARVSAPGHLLSAVTLTETGRRGPEGKKLLAWPWTINAGGKGYVFPTKGEAVRAVRRMLAEGKRSIDVGCMQVNLKYHPRAFTSLEEAFDPAANLAYGADFLARLKQRHGSWELAVQHYHSYTEEHRLRYAARFNTLWAMERKRRAGDQASSKPAVARERTALAKAAAAPRTLGTAVLPDLELLRRLKPLASLMTLGINLNGLGGVTEAGTPLFRQLTGGTAALPDTRTRSAALGRAVAVN